MPYNLSPELQARQRQIYYVTQAIESLNGLPHMTYGLAVDCLMESNNNYVTLAQLSDAFKVKNIMLSPERIYSSLSFLNCGELFDNFPDKENYQVPFRLNPKVYKDFSQTDDYIKRLHTYVDDFLKKNERSLSFKDGILDILLESIFNCNIKYLKLILSVKDEKRLQQIIKEPLMASYSSPDEACRLYNLMLTTSNAELDEILRGLIFRMFDFLALNFDTKHSQRLQQTFGGKIYYLDSSFILRLLGFDGNFRKERAMELIHALSSIDGIQFIVHEKSIEETQYRIKEVIGKSTKLLSRNPQIVASIIGHDEDGLRQSPVFDLYRELYETGKVRTPNDFSLYFSHVKSLLLSEIASLKFDDKNLPNPSTARKRLIRALSENTDKSNSRITLIARLLDYVENLRQSNNFNISDIKHWLITTDKKTLDLDNQTGDKDSNAKGICIMPSELIRLIDGFTGDIMGQHLSVFKNYMLKSHVFPQQYSEYEEKTITKIATIVEHTDLVQYDVDEMAKRLLQNNSIREIQKRLDRLKIQRQKDEEIIKLFNESNAEFIDNKYTNTIKKIAIEAEKKAKILWQLMILLINLFFIAATAFFIIDWNNFNFLLPETYFDDNRWGFITILLAPASLWLPTIRRRAKIYKVRFINNFTTRRINKYIS